jgi:hypothetical protein
VRAGWAALAVWMVIAKNTGTAASARILKIFFTVKFPQAANYPAWLLNHSSASKVVKESFLNASMSTRAWRALPMLSSNYRIGSGKVAFARRNVLGDDQPPNFRVSSHLMSSRWFAIICACQISAMHITDMTTRHTAKTAPFCDSEAGLLSLI